jgi:proline iminopeptidase
MKWVRRALLEFLFLQITGLVWIFGFGKWKVWKRNSLALGYWTATSDLDVTLFSKSEIKLSAPLLLLWRFYRRFGEWAVYTTTDVHWLNVANPFELARDPILIKTFRHHSRKPSSAEAFTFWQRMSESDRRLGSLDPQVVASRAQKWAHHRESLQKELNIVSTKTFPAFVEEIEKQLTDAPAAWWPQREPLLRPQRWMVDAIRNEMPAGEFLKGQNENLLEVARAQVHWELWGLLGQVRLARNYSDVLLHLAQLSGLFSHTDPIRETENKFVRHLFYYEPSIPDQELNPLLHPSLIVSRPPEPKPNSTPAPLANSNLFKQIIHSEHIIETQNEFGVPVPLDPSDGSCLERAGGKIWYKVSGTKRDCGTLFLHGGPGYNAFAFEKFVGRQLSTEHPMIYIDQRGCGRSNAIASDGELSVTATVDDIEAIRALTGFKKLNLIGHSFGGLIALEYYARFPERVNKLILMEVSPDLVASSQYQLEAALRLFPDFKPPSGESPRQKLAKIFENVGWKPFQLAMFWNSSDAQKLNETVDRLSWLGDVSPMRLIQSLEKEGYLDSRHPELLKPLTVPAIALAGRKSHCVGALNLQTAARAWGCPIHWFDESGHFPYVEETEMFVQTVLDFLYV